MTSLEESWLLSLDKLELLSEDETWRLLSIPKLSSDCLKVPLEKPGEKLTVFKSVPATIEKVLCQKIS